jgi:hypothetical protein
VVANPTPCIVNRIFQHLEGARKGIDFCPNWGQNNNGKEAHLGKSFWIFSQQMEGIEVGRYGNYKKHV